jgi:peptide/nickel transport system substrate-binding protein
MKRLSMLASLLFVLILLSCGNNHDNANKKKDTVTVSVNMVVKTLDPHDISSLVQNQLHRQMYETFFFLDDFTKQYEPRLATQYEVSPDGKTYTFTLRSNVKFHNGEIMKASDVVYSYQRAMKNPTLNTFTSMIDTVEAKGDNAVVITLKKPFAPFLHHTTNINIISQKAAEALGDSLGTTSEDAGTGPYRMTSYKPDTLIKMTAFDDYYRGKPAIKTLDIKPIVDASTGLVALENGEIDYYSIPLANWKEVVDSGKFTTKIIPSNHITYLLLNPNRGALKNPDVRKAIAYAIDRDAINVAAYEGLAKVAYHMLNPDYVFGAPTEDEGVVYKYDLAKSKEYLVKAGYPNGVDIGVLTTLAGTYFDKAAQVIQANLATAGISMKVAAMEQGALISAMMKGEYDLIVSGYACQMDYDFFATLTKTQGNDASLAKFKGSDVDYVAIDQLFDKGAAEMDPEQRKAIYKELDSRIMDTGVWNPLFHKANTLAWKKNLETKVYANYYYVYDWSWQP